MPILDPKHVEYVTMTKERRDLFYSLVSPEPNSGCHLWLGPTISGGYGAFYTGQDTRPAHTVALALVGKFPTAGLEIDHKCRNRCCVNPEHLEYVTRQENIRRRLPFKRNCTEGKGTKVMITFRSSVLKIIDRERKRRGLSRSGWLSLLATQNVESGESE